MRTCFAKKPYAHQFQESAMCLSEMPSLYWCFAFILWPLEVENMKNDTRFVAFGQGNLEKYIEELIIT